MRAVESAGMLFATVSLKTGAVLVPPSGVPSQAVDDLASAAPELVSVADADAWSELLASYGSQRSDEGFDETIVLSPRATYIVRRFPEDRTRVLIAVDSGVGRLGLLLSAVRAQLHEQANAP